MSTIEEARKAAVTAAEKEARNATEQASQEAKEAEAAAKSAQSKADWEDLKEKAAKSESAIKTKILSAWGAFTSTPAYWVSALGAVNLLLIGGAGAFAYQRRDRVKAEPEVAAGALAVVAALVGAEGYAASKQIEKQKKSD